MKKTEENEKKKSSGIPWGWITAGGITLLTGAIIVSQRKRIQLSRDTINKQLGIIENQQTLIKGQTKTIEKLNYSTAKLAEENYKLKENYGNK